MKILAFFPTVGRGGVTRVVETILPALSKYADISVLGQTFNEYNQRVQYPVGMPFRQIEPGHLPSHPHQFEFIISNAQVFVNEAQEIQDNFDLIWNISPWFSVGASEFCGFRKPLVINIADFAFDHIDMGSYLTTFFRGAAPKLAARADYTIFSSDFQRHWAEDYYGFYRAETIHYCTGFSPTPHGSLVHPNLPKHYLLAFHPMGHKDPVTILKAYAYARDKLHGDIPPLVLAGLSTDGLFSRDPRRTQDMPLRRMIQDVLNLQPNKDVYAAGYVEDEAIENLYARARMALVASRSEGDLSGSVHEAIHYRVPLVYGNLPVFTEQLQHRVHGLEFPIGEARAMGDMIIETLQFPEAARGRTRYAYNDLEARTVDDVAKDFMKVFEKVVQEAVKP